MRAVGLLSDGRTPIIQRPCGDIAYIRACVDSFKVRLSMPLPKILQNNPAGIKEAYTMEVYTYHGFEIPVDTSELAKRVLRQLSKTGVVVYENDDGPSLLVRVELERIAGAIGIDCYYTVQRDHYRLVLIDSENDKSPVIKINGAEHQDEAPELDSLTAVSVRTGLTKVVKLSK